MMKEKKDLRIQKTYKLLAEALIKLLQEKPFAEIRLNEICEGALVHKTTFYHHFTDKYDLLKYTITLIQKEIMTKLDTSSDTNLLDYYCNLAKIYMSNIKKNQQFYRSILSSEGNTICTDLLYDMFVEDVEKRLGQVEIPIFFVSSYYVSGVFAVINEWFRRGMKEEEDVVIEYLKKMITNHNFIPQLEK